jgi:hypothetical protein
MLLQRLVGERKAHRIRFEEEIEGIDHGHFGDEDHFNRKVAGCIGLNDPREKITVRVLLPVNEVLLRLDAQRIARN